MNEPYTRPLSTLNELLEWKGVNLPYSKPVPWSIKFVHNYPKTIICHDMAGGYLDDRFCQGLVCYDGYKFNYWSHIDGFIYFSHHLVTIPPSSWVNCAHLNGIPIYGTFITEGDEGNQVCSRMFASKSVCKLVADILIELTLFHHFDGWLLNIENSIEDKNIENVRYFIEYLTKQLHQKLPLSKVIWYDSVTVDGELKWQNELNHKNMPFYLCCDGIFLNYTWQENNLINSIDNKKNSAKNYVGDIEPEIYVGIDVFGRGMIGDGGLNTKAAIELVRKHSLSVAIFAPAWTYEKFKPEERAKMDQRFWLEISPFLYPGNYRFSRLPIRFNHLKRTFHLKEPIKSENSKDSSEFCSEIKVPLLYLSNLCCQSTLPLLLPTTPHANYIATKRLDSIIYTRSYDFSNESYHVLVPLYMLSINLSPSQVVSITADFAIPAFEVKIVPVVYSVGIKYKIVKPLRDGFVDEDREYIVEIPFMPELLGVKSLKSGKLPQRYLNLKILSRSMCKMDSNWVTHNRELLKGCGKVSNIKLALTLEADKENLECESAATFEIREIYVKVDDYNQTNGNFMFALTYFNMKLDHSHQKEELALTEKNLGNYSNFDNMKMAECWDFFVREYEFCEGSNLKLHLSWVVASDFNLPTQRVYCVSSTTDQFTLKCVPDEQYLDSVKRVVEKDHCIDDCEYFAIFKKISYKYSQGAEDKNFIVAGAWTFIGITTNHSYYLDHIFRNSGDFKDLVPWSIIFLLHPLNDQFLPRLNNDLHEEIHLAQSPTIKISFSQE